MQHLFQNPYASLNPRSTVAVSSAIPVQLFFGARRRECDKGIRELLDRVSLRGLAAAKSPRELSGGDRRRVRSYAGPVAR